MYISKLAIHQVRNISSMEIKPHPYCNIIVGENGSGKSSILEAIHVLGFGRSFRKSKIAELIQFGCSELTVFATADIETSIDLIESSRFGIRKSKTGESEIRIQGNKARRLSQLSSQFPIISFTSDSLDLIDAGPSIRRRFIDWLVFHVKRDIEVAAIYRDFDKVLEQRNEALKKGKRQEIRVWDPKLIELNYQIAQMRSEIIEQLNSEMQGYYPKIESKFSEVKSQLQYKQGWNSDLDYALLLDNNLDMDIRRKSTSAGSHRDDIYFTLDEKPVKNILSRGESKRFVLALLLSAERLIDKANDKNCIWIFDDIAAELDLESLKRTFSVSHDLKNQMFFTCIEKDLPLIQQVIDYEHAVFHVKHGQLVN
ncbi:DNA replication/repair protein RecF [Catenovulum sediminis]|uniref:DNA replication and repair protein RecF n=1 Tax=Catenovulum sediminis TaxID=1740262 RepID=A0ABV1RMT6_9ALTE|nr:DNA replication/repair protein RecF [Catenovulum sediminis]